MLLDELVVVGDLLGRRRPARNLVRRIGHEPQALHQLRGGPERGGGVVAPAEMAEEGVGHERQKVYPVVDEVASHVASASRNLERGAPPLVRAAVLGRRPVERAAARAAVVRELTPDLDPVQANRAGPGEPIGQLVEAELGAVVLGLQVDPAVALAHPCRVLRLAEGAVEPRAVAVRSPVPASGVRCDPVLPRARLPGFDLVALLGGHVEEFRGWSARGRAEEHIGRAGVVASHVQASALVVHLGPGHHAPPKVARVPDRPHARVHPVVTEGLEAQLVVVEAAGADAHVLENGEHHRDHVCWAAQRLRGGSEPPQSLVRGLDHACYSRPAQPWLFEHIRNVEPAAFESDRLGLNAVGLRGLGLLIPTAFALARFGHAAHDRVRAHARPHVLARALEVDGHKRPRPAGRYDRIAGRRVRREEQPASVAVEHQPRIPMHHLDAPGAVDVCTQA